MRVVEGLEGYTFEIFHSSSCLPVTLELCVESESVGTAAVGVGIADTASRQLSSTATMQQPLWPLVCWGDGDVPAISLLTSIERNSFARCSPLWLS